MFVFYEYEQKRNVVQAASTATYNLARSLAQHAEDTFEQADLAVQEFCDRIATGGSDPAAIARLAQLTKARVQASSRIHGLFLYGADGSLLAGSFGTVNGPNNSDREYFRFHRETGDLGPHLGTPIRSRSEDRWMITLSRRYNDRAGNFGGVVLATIDIEDLTRYYSQFDVGRLGAIALMNAGGIVLARHPYLDDFIGRDLSKTRISTDIALSAESGVLSIPSQLDNIVRLFSFQRGRRFPILVTVAEAETDVLADWRESAARRLLAVVLMMVIIAGLGYQLLAYIRRHRAAANVLHTLSRTDPLTGLANRRAFDGSIAAECARSGRQKVDLSLILIDLDRFKLFNDTYGHQAGDDCLRAVSEVVRQQARRASDVAARYGGEELAILLPGTDHDGAVAVADGIRRAVETLAVQHSGNLPAGVATISAGVVTASDEITPAQLIGLADAALYEAKRDGRNRVCASPTPRRPGALVSIPLAAA